MKKAHAIKAAFAAAIIAVSGGAAGVDSDKPAVVEKLANGFINWTDGIITLSATAKYPKSVEDMDEARLKAERIGTIMARRSLLEAVKGVRIESNTVVNDMMVSKDVIRTAVEGLVENSRIVGTQHQPDNSVKITVEMTMRGKMSGVLLENLKGGEKKGELKELLNNIGRAFASLLNDAISIADEAYAKIDDTRKPTGLIIDATEISVKPGLFPKIHDENGKKLYGPGIYDSVTASEKGSVGIAPTIEEAKKDVERLGKVALVCKALIPTGVGGIDLGVKGVDMGTLKTMMDDPAVVKKCGVSIVYKVTF
jgi:hypothetical protein